MWFVNWRLVGKSIFWLRHVEMTSDGILSYCYMFISNHMCIFILLVGISSSQLTWNQKKIYFAWRTLNLFFATISFMRFSCTTVVNFKRKCAWFTLTLFFMQNNISLDFWGEVWSVACFILAVITLPVFSLIKCNPFQLVNPHLQMPNICMNTLKNCMKLHLALLLTSTHNRTDSIRHIPCKLKLQVLEEKSVACALLQ